MIVGIETQVDVTFSYLRRGGKPFRMMLTTIQRQLHATKGWRQISRRSEVYYPVDLDRKPTRTFERTAPDKEREGLKTLSESDMEKARLRHHWYRKKKAWDAFRASLPEENRL